MILAVSDANEMDMQVWIHLHGLKNRSLAEVAKSKRMEIAFKIELKMARSKFPLASENASSMAAKQTVKFC